GGKYKERNYAEVFRDDSGCGDCDFKDNLDSEFLLSYVNEENDREQPWNIIVEGNGYSQSHLLEREYIQNNYKIKHPLENSGCFYYVRNKTLNCFVIRTLTGIVIRTLNGGCKHDRRKQERSRSSGRESRHSRSY